MASLGVKHIGSSLKSCLFNLKSVFILLITPLITNKLTINLTTSKLYSKSFIFSRFLVFNLHRLHLLDDYLN